MDEMDLKILSALQFDARVQNVDLAKKVGLSQAPCWNRARQLEQAGVIEKYVTIIAQAELGFADTVIVEVVLDRHDDEIFRKFESALARIPQIIEAYLATGEYDYFIKAAVAGTDGYERFLRERIYKLPGIRHSRSSFLLRCLKQTYSMQVDPSHLVVSSRPTMRGKR